MANISVGLWFGGLTLDPGAEATWFEDDVSPIQVRWFTAMPINSLIDDFVVNDQLIEVTDVFHILKGKNHEIDGTGGTGTLQVNVTVRNLDPANAVTFEIYKAETQPSS
jgi:hypothetical protein